MLLMDFKSIYAIQPYQVGCKKDKKKSLAVIIPAKIAREYNVDPSTIFALKVDQERKTITLQIIDDAFKKEMRPADESFSTSRQQVSLEVQ